MADARHSEPALAGEGICLGDCQVVLTHCRAKAQNPGMGVVILTVTPYLPGEAPHFPSEAIAPFQGFSIL
jgi:hypothetical protein